VGLSRIRGPDEVQLSAGPINPVEGFTMHKNLSTFSFLELLGREQV